jgi:hypothetical protein
MQLCLASSNQLQTHGRHPISGRDQEKGKSCNFLLGIKKNGGQNNLPGKEGSLFSRSCVFLLISPTIFIIPDVVLSSFSWSFCLHRRRGREISRKRRGGEKDGLAEKGGIVL